MQGVNHIQLLTASSTLQRLHIERLHLHNENIGLCHGNCKVSQLRKTKILRFGFSLAVIKILLLNQLKTA